MTSVLVAGRTRGGRILFHASKLKTFTMSDGYNTQQALQRRKWQCYKVTLQTLENNRLSSNERWCSCLVYMLAGNHFLSQLIITPVCLVVLGHPLSCRARQALAASSSSTGSPPKRATYNLRYVYKHHGLSIDILFSISMHRSKFKCTAPRPPHNNLSVRPNRRAMA